jgi:L-methionine (R)-S-oxide reductase
MFSPERDSTASKAESYAQLAEALAALIGDEPDVLANLANAAALVYHSLPDVNWAGFYLLRGSDLVLGPFQGKPACVRIGPGRGVCGAAAARRATVVVPDVHAFPGHIACDSESRSEIVVPLLDADQLRGVLDVDARTVARFDEEDRQGLERFVATLSALLRWSDLDAAVSPRA